MQRRHKIVALSVLSLAFFVIVLQNGLFARGRGGGGGRGGGRGGSRSAGGRGSGARSGRHSSSGAMNAAPRQVSSRGRTHAPVRSSGNRARASSTPARVQASKSVARVSSQAPARSRRARIKSDRTRRSGRWNRHAGYRGRHWRRSSGWGSSAGFLFGFGAGLWTSSWYYSPWDCDYAPGYGLWYFRRPCAWYARPYGCWFYWNIVPDYPQPVLVIESEKKNKSLWFAVYTKEGDTLVQRESPRKLSRKENKYLFTNRTAGDIIVIARNDETLANKIGREDQHSSKLYIVQSDAIHKNNIVDDKQLTSTKTQIKNRTLEEQEDARADNQLKHADESLSVESLMNEAAA